MPIRSETIVATNDGTRTRIRIEKIKQKFFNFSLKYYK